MTNAREQQGVDDFGQDEPVYVISIAARIVGMHAQTLRTYERLGLVEPKRTVGNIRMYSRADIERMRQVQRLVNDLGVNLAGVEVILRMSEKMQSMEAELQRLRERVQRREAEGMNMVTNTQIKTALMQIERIERELAELKELLTSEKQEAKSLRGLWAGAEISDEDIDEAKNSWMKKVNDFDYGD